MESESKNIIQMLKNIKCIIETSKERGCWKDTELKDIGITYRNVCEIGKQLENPPKIEELPEDLKESEELPESIELKLNN